MNKCQIPDWGTPELLAEILRRSAAGEGVVDVINEKKLPELQTLLWLRDHHHADIVSAKREQRRRSAKTGTKTEKGANGTSPTD